MPTDIKLPIQPVMGTQRVWTRAKWENEWTPRPGLCCTQFKKGTIPQVGTALLHWIAGRVSLPGEFVSKYRAPLDIKHHFVKVEYQPYEEGAAPIQWFGTVEEIHEKRGDRLKDVDGSIVSGKKQQFSCLELTMLLSRTPILEGWFNDGGVAKKLGMAPIFNEGGLPNRSENTVDGVHLFAKDKTNAKFWSSLDAIKYLLKHFQPKTGLDKPIFSIPASGTAQGIQLHSSAEPLVHSWDQPVFGPHGKDLNIVLGMLLDQRAGMGGYLSTESFNDGLGPSAEFTYLRAFTFAEQDVSLSLDGMKKLKANPTQWNIITDGQPGLLVDLKDSQSDVYTQIVCQGARRLAVGTFSNSDGTWDRNWSDDLQAKYNAGGSGAVDYDDLPKDDDRRNRNTEIRNSDELATVYSRFRIKDTWNGKVKGGNGSTEVPLIFDDNQALEVFGNWPLDRNIQPVLPMREGEDYTNPQSVNQTWNEPVDYRRVMVFMPYKNDATKWFHIEAGGMAKTTTGDNRNWSCSVHTERKPGSSQSTDSLRLKTGGQPQHVLANAEFSPLPVDEAIIKYDWKKMLVTLAIEEPRFCEARWPAQVAFGVPAVRTKVIHCGDGFQLNYMAPNTVIGIDATNGDLKRVSSLNGGGYFIRDDRKKLEEIARAMFEFYSKPRIALGLTKKGATAVLGLGDMIHQLGATSDPSGLVDVVNSVVTELSVVMPEGGGQPTQHWSTNRGELDHVPARMAGK